MARLDSLQRPAKRVRRSEPEYETFHETLVPVMPGSVPYRQPEVAEPSLDYPQAVAPSASTQPIYIGAKSQSMFLSLAQIIVSVLCTLLALRFIMSLITFDHSFAPLAVLYLITDWMIAPMSALVQQTPITGLGLIEWGTLITLGLVMVIGKLAGFLIRAAHI